jgi:hypothetical protein
VSIVSTMLFVCIASVPDDPCVYFHPEEGRGHVAYSRTMTFADLSRESLTECEIVHGDGACDVSCWVSRGDTDVKL